MPENATAPSTPAAQAAAARLAGMKPPPASASAAPAAPIETTAKVTRAGKAKVPRAGKEGADEGEKQKKVPSKKLLAVLVVVVLGGGFVAKSKFLKPHYGPGATVPLGAITPLGTITTNLSDGHLAQVTISLQLTAPASTKTVTKEQDRLTATAVTDLGAQTYNGLLDPAGRTALRAELLAGFQSDLGTVDGAQQVAAVYFTGFILQ